VEEEGEEDTGGTENRAEERLNGGAHWIF
jgi:hypothetical protein